MILLNAVGIKENIEKRVIDDLSCGRIGGAAVLVKQHGKTVYKNLFGKASDSDAIAEDSIFRLASMTKPITAVAVMRQVEKGLVALDDCLDRFIPEYGEMDIAVMDENNLPKTVKKAQGKIKILHLLTHTSGVGSGTLGNYLSANGKRSNRVDLRSIAEEYASYPISFEPYTNQSYSATVGFDILARIVEITSGLPFDEFLKREIFSPLGMCDTTFTPTDEQWSRTVHMHNFDGEKSFFLPLDKNHIFESFPLTHFCGGAGLVSTLPDYEKFADMLLSGGLTADGHRILSEESVRLMRTASIPHGIMPGSAEWGLSMRVITDPNYRLPLGTFGWSGAYGTHFWIDPENQIIGIYMKNSRYDGGSGAKTASNFEKDVYL